MTDRYQQLKLQLASVPLPHPTAPHRNGSLCCCCCCCCCWMLFCSTAWTCYSYIRVCCWDEGTGYTRVADCDMRFIVMLHRLLWKVLNVVRYWSPSLNGSHPHRTASNSSPFVVAECMCSIDGENLFASYSYVGTRVQDTRGLCCRLSCEFRSTVDAKIILLWKGISICAWCVEAQCIILGERFIGLGGSIIRFTLYPRHLTFITWVSQEQSCPPPLFAWIDRS